MSRLYKMSVEELKHLHIKEYEIYFVNESYEGDEIKVYKKKVKNYYFIEGRTESKTIFKSVLKIRKR